MNLTEKERQRFTRVVNTAMKKHMQEFFSFIQIQSEGTITEAILQKIYGNFMKGVFEKVTYKSKDVSETIDVVKSKFVKNRLLLKGTSLVMKASILKIVGIEASNGDLNHLREKDMNYCDSVSVPHLSIEESVEFVKTRQV